MKCLNAKHSQYLLTTNKYATIGNRFRSSFISLLFSAYVFPKIYVCHSYKPTHTNNCMLCMTQLNMCSNHARVRNFWNKLLLKQIDRWMQSSRHFLSVRVHNVCAVNFGSTQIFQLHLSTSVGKCFTYQLYSFDCQLSSLFVFSCA